MPSCRGRSPLLAPSTGHYLSLPALACIGLLAADPAPGQPGGRTSGGLPSVASINLCTDQLVLSLAAPGQILSLSWLSADPEESMLAEAAARYPLNYGSAEELLEIGADVVVAGAVTSPFTRQLLRRLGTTIVDVEAAASLADVERNLAQVGAAIGRDDEAAGLVAAMRVRAGSVQARAESIRAEASAAPRSAIVVRPGGFTIGRDTLANELLELAGLTNSIAGLDRWGSLSIETLLEREPEFIVFTRYRAGEPSLANAIFAHPALVSLAGAQKTLAVESRHFACGAPESLAAAEALIEQMAAN